MCSSDLDLLATVLKGLFRNLLRFELFVTDHTDAIVPVVKLGEGQFGSGLKLLESLRSRLKMKEEGGESGPEDGENRRAGGA